MARPVAISSLPALEELVTDERGVMFTAEDPQSLAESVQPLLDDANLRHRLGAAGRDHVLTHRTWDANQRKYQHIHSQLQTIR